MNIKELLEKIEVHWPIILFVITVIFTAGKLYSDVNTLKANVEKEFEELSKSIKEQTETIDSMANDINDQISGIQEQVYILAGADPEIIGLKISDTYKESVIKCVGTLDSCVKTDASILYASVVAYDSEGNEYTVKDVAQKKLLLPYKEQGKDCFFYGQLDEYGNWDGECVINIYDDQKLALITEALYDSGNLITFRQAFPNVRNGETIWYFSKRIMEDDFSSGETLSFMQDIDFQQSFSYDGVAAEDILTCDKLYSQMDHPPLEGYYNGRTSNGRYNDTSGTAYMVKYFNDGTVRTLYTGMFKRGTFDDSTGNAWMIGRNDTISQYSYYKGPFKNGYATYSPKDKNSPWEIDIDQKRIDELVESFTCNKTITVPLTGLVPDDGEEIA